MEFEFPMQIGIERISHYRPTNCSECGYTRRCSHWNIYWNGDLSGSAFICDDCLSGWVGSWLKDLMTDSHEDLISIRYGGNIPSSIADYWLGDVK